MSNPQLTDLLTRADLRTLTIRADGRPLTDAEKALIYNASWGDLQAARDALAANVSNAQVENDWAHELQDLLSPFIGGHGGHRRGRVAADATGSGSPRRRAAPPDRLTAVTDVLPDTDPVRCATCHRRLVQCREVLLCPRCDSADWLASL